MRIWKGFLALINPWRWSARSYFYYKQNVFAQKRANKVRDGASYNLHLQTKLFWNWERFSFANSIYILAFTFKTLTFSCISAGHSIRFDVEYKPCNRTPRWRGVHCQLCRMRRRTQRKHVLAQIRKRFMYLSQLLLLFTNKKYSNSLSSSKFDMKCTNRIFIMKSPLIFSAI